MPTIVSRKKVEKVEKNVAATILNILKMSQLGGAVDRSII
jgi:hypothetical protein